MAEARISNVLKNIHPQQNNSSFWLSIQLVFSPSVYLDVTKELANVPRMRNTRTTGAGLFVILKAVRVPFWHHFQQ